MDIEIVSNGYPDLIQKLQLLPIAIRDLGKNWSSASAGEANRRYRDNLERQGRAGGLPPPLSPVTLHLYQNYGAPDGSGIRDHIEVEFVFGTNESIGVVGILSGRPSMIARVQDQGATIKVSRKQRRFLASRGAFVGKYINIPPRFAWTQAIRDTNDWAEDSLRQRFKIIIKNI